MKKAAREEFNRFAEMIGGNVQGAVYPLSVIGGIQSGDIYEDGGTALIWHKCGFAVLVGERRADRLAFVYDLIKNGGRRLVLFADDEETALFFKEKPDIAVGTRYFYTFEKRESPRTELPEGFSISEINAGNIGGLNGRIIPAFSWDNEEFLEKGKGYCVIHENEPVSWAFSAAVSGNELDIGVETAERYRGYGLASAAASALIGYALSLGKTPVWACHSGNTGSRRTAEKLGFVKTSETRTFGNS